MTGLDWLIIAVYLLAMLCLAAYLGLRQRSRSDYYLGAKNLPNWALASSIVATQCSTNSLLGAPAFVGFTLGGGLLWLQYELAVPLAMLLLCYAFVPLKQANVISVYAYLEQRLGTGSRLLASGCFLFFRGVATGVTVYGVASVISLITGVSFTAAVLLLMGITIVYDLFGGMRAVVISDVLQMLLLTAAVLLALSWLWQPMLENWSLLEERRVALKNDWGLSSGEDYGFWPMLIGGLFLYTAYYGCDQSQAQRLLAAASPRDTQKVLLLNGILRFPLVMLYCLVGLGLAAYALQQSNFVGSLAQTASGAPNFNLVFPAYVLREFPVGLTGLVIVGLLAAAMSSIDSALNSLSAGTVEDFVTRRYPQLSERVLLKISKVATLFWGLFAVAFSYQVEHIAPTILEAINKVGSMANGPLLALFTIAIFIPKLGQRAAIVGFFLGLAANILVAINLEGVSWLWWNPIGFATSLGSALVVAVFSTRGFGIELPGVELSSGFRSILLSTAALILLICLGFSHW